MKMHIILTVTQIISPKICMNVASVNSNATHASKLSEKNFVERQTYLKDGSQLQSQKMNANV